MSKQYHQPILTPHPTEFRLAGGWLYFDRVRISTRDGFDVVDASSLPDEILSNLVTPRRDLTGLAMDRPHIMGILNVTPDSFSDGGAFNTLDTALKQAQAMQGQGATVLDIGGESTRPGAKFVPVDQEIERVAPIIEKLHAVTNAVISIDTRKSDVASAALRAGANWINDVSAMTFDPDMARIAADQDVPICLMHAQGTPDTMQDNPSYDDVVMDVYDDLERQIIAAEHAGIGRDKIIVDPGIGFGKTLDHNLALLKNLSVFHGLGCAILLGASRKRFIGTITETELATDRVIGSVSVAQHGLACGVQIMRVHDVLQTKQAFQLYSAIHTADSGVPD